MIKYHRFKKQCGLTLIELMVAMGLGLILVLSGVVIYSNTVLKISSIRTAQTLNQKARTILSLLAAKTESAGLMYCNAAAYDDIVTYTTSISDKELTIKTPIPNWSAISYTQNRSNEKLTGKGPSSFTSDCGNSKITYYVSAHRIIYDSNARSLSIRNYGNESVMLADGTVENFTVQFGLSSSTATGFDAQYVNEYVDTLIDASGTATERLARLRTIKYSISLSANETGATSDSSQRIGTFTRVVPIKNLWKSPTG